MPPRRSPNFITLCCAAAVIACTALPAHARGRHVAHRERSHSVPVSPALREAGVPAPLARLLARTHIPASHVSIYVARVDSNLGTRRRTAPAPLITLNADVPRNPASTMKLVTSTAAFDLLGPDYRWRTATYTDGQIQDGVLHGNLYFKGRGDPKLVPEEMEKLIAAIHAAGINEIQGDLVLDRSYYGPGIGDSGPIDDGVDRPYNVQPDALLYSFRAVSFGFAPGPDGAVAITELPPLANLMVMNNLALARGACGDWLADAHPQVTPAADGTLMANFSGRYASTCGEQHWSVAAPDANGFFLGGFRALWEASGGRLTGGVRDGLVPRGARLVATHDGQTLSEIIHDMNKFSNNVMARQIFLTLGAKAYGAPATTDKASRAVHAWLARNGMDLPGLTLDNGSGLSREERVSAEGLARVLQHAINAPTGQAFLDSLPLAGIDGTMRHRLRDDGVTGNAHIKTGTLDNVRAIAGYVGTRSGSSYVVVSIVNDENARAANPFNDALLEWIYDHAP